MAREWFFSSVQLLSCVQLFVTPWTAARQTSLSIINLQILLRLMSIKLVMTSNHLILCHSLLLPLLIFPGIRVFSNELVLHIKSPKYWNFSFNISSSNEYSGLMSFRIDWFDLLTVQGTLKSLLHIHVNIWYPFLPDLLHSVWQTLGSSTQYNWLNFVPLYD